MDNVHLSTARHFRYELKIFSSNLECERCAAHHNGRRGGGQKLANFYGHPLWAHKLSGNNTKLFFEFSHRASCYFMKNYTKDQRYEYDENSSIHIHIPWYW